MNTPDRIPLEGPARSAAAGKCYGVLGAEFGDCEAAWMGGNCEAALRGSALGNCEAAKKEHCHSPTVLEKCRLAGREGGIKGKDYGIFGGRHRLEPGNAPREAQKGLVRPAKFEPRAGHELKAVKYIREQLRARRLGKFTPDDNDDDDPSHRGGGWGGANP